MDYPAVEPLEQPLGAADRGVECHVLAGGVAVEGDVHVVDAGAGHHDSFRDRAQRLTYRPMEMAGLIAGADIMSAAGPHSRITRGDPAWSARAITAILTPTPASIPGRNVLRATLGPGTGSRSVVPVRP